MNAPRFPHLRAGWAAVLAALLVPLSLPASDSTLPDGTEFTFWEPSPHFSKTYHVDGNSPAANDEGPGTAAQPFRTINRAAQVLQPGERVVIAAGVYREFIQPARGGTGPDALISYEAAPGAQVVVKGSRVVTDWQPSTGWRTGNDPATGEPVKTYQLDLTPDLFPDGYNPFAVDNVIGNRYWINYAADNMANYFRRRGLVFVDGKPLEPVESPTALAAPSTRSLNFWSDIAWSPLFEEFQPYAGKVWVEMNGMRLHIRLADDADPADHTIEITTQEQCFSPAERYQAYIRVKGIHFMHAGNGFPVPQRGMVSVNRGHHFIFEDNTFEWANSVGLDIGNEDWAAAAPPEPVGYAVIRGNTFRYCGIEGLGGTGGPTDNLVDKNLFEWIGWQDAVRMSESGGTKMHTARNTLFRHNILRHIRHANGIWIDIGNANVRFTGNVFADIPGGVNPHAIHIEGSLELNQIDNNIFSDLTAGVLIRDTNNVIIAHNLFLDCEEAGIEATSGIGGPRPIFGRTLDVRNLRIHGNIFAGMRDWAIQITNDHNDLDGNVYGRNSANAFFTRPFLRVLFPEPEQQHNLASAREIHGWEEHGAMADITAHLDPDTLELTLKVDGEAVQPRPPLDAIDTDFYGQPVTGPRVAGPFADLLSGPATRNIDPR